MTQGDRIRQMDDLSLATMIVTLLQEVEDNFKNKLAAAGVSAAIISLAPEVRIKSYLQFLQEEVGDNDTL